MWFNSHWLSLKVSKNLCISFSFSLSFVTLCKERPEDVLNAFFDFLRIYDGSDKEWKESVSSLWFLRWVILQRNDIRCEVELFKNWEIQIDSITDRVHDLTMFLIVGLQIIHFFSFWVSWNYFIRTIVRRSSSISAICIISARQVDVDHVRYSSWLINVSLSITPDDLHQSLPCRSWLRYPSYHFESALSFKLIGRSTSVRHVRRLLTYVSVKIIVDISKSRCQRRVCILKVWSDDFCNFFLIIRFIDLDISESHDLSWRFVHYH